MLPNSLYLVFHNHKVCQENQNIKSKFICLNFFQGLFVETGCSKNGSRCLENIWKNLDVKQRKRIAEELSQNEDRLRRDRFGHFLYRNLGLNQFVKRRNDWLEHQGVLSKRRRMLTQLLHGKGKELH